MPKEGPGKAREADDAVVARLKSGDITALEEILNLYRDRVFRVCFGVLANRHDAEDATQEVFLRAYRQASKFSGRSRYSTWLLRLAANHTLNLAKVSSRRKRLSGPLGEEQTASHAQAPEHEAIRRERSDAVVHLLQQIPVDQRQVLVLREMEGLSYAELARVLGVPIGTVTSRLVRGREKLRALAHDSESDALEPG